MGRMVAALGVCVGCWASGEVPRLTQIEVDAADEGAVVHVRVTAPVTAKLVHLSDPPRAYVDFPGVAWVGGSESIQAGGTGGLVRVRWALFRESPPTARVVLDLAPGAQARVLEAAEGLFVIAVRPGQASAQPSSGVARTRLLEGVHVVLDPAGGGTGVRGPAITDDSITLDVALQAAVALMDMRALVTLTRDTDRAVSTEARAELIRTVRPDVVVRIACATAEDTSQQGVATRYAAQGSAGLAAALQSAIVDSTGAAGKGTALSADAPTGVSSARTVTCVVGYLSSPSEGKLLASTEYRGKIAAGIAQGIAAYFGRNIAAR